MKKIVIAPDSFKESLSAKQVAHEIAQAIAAVMPHVQTVQVPMADGGEGTLEALIDATEGQFHTAIVRGPLGAPVTAQLFRPAGPFAGLEKRALAFNCSF